MHFKDIAQFFNISDFLLYCCLFIFSVLLSLRVDRVITWNYAIVFLPIWIWNAIELIGTIVGVAFFIKKKSLRQDDVNRRYFVGMIQYAFLQFPIFLTELLVVVNIESNGRHSWTAIFTPMYILSFLSIGGCILSCYMKRLFVVLEVLLIVNILQLLFLGVQLDGFVNWSWGVVFIPTWILLILFFVSIIVYSCVSYCMVNHAENSLEGKIKRPVVTVLIACLFVINFSFLLFLALLASQLNGQLRAPYTATFVPLHITVLVLIVTTFVNYPANPLWFGVRKTFYDFVLDTCPLLQEYGNISYQGGHDEQDLVESEDELESSGVQFKKTKRGIEKAIIADSTIDDSIYPYEDIMMPD